MLNNRLVIGFDYGTTYTGVAYCETSDTGVVGKDIQVVQDWPVRYTKICTRDKIPSEIALKDRTKWGALIAPNEPRHIWTKLLLDNPKAGEMDNFTKELLLDDAHGLSTEPVDIIAAYLTHVKAHLLTNLDNKYGKELWRTLPITLVTTVPAAGFNSTDLPGLKRAVLTTEPEAAAIYTIQSLRGGVQDQQFAIGDGFIVCDMGGGTVDLISYRFAELEPTTLEEATVGTGDKCGGSFVERGFLKWLERRLGTADFVLIAGDRSEELPRTSLSSKLSRMVQDFILEAKSGFSGYETNFLRLPAPLSSIEDDETRGIQDGEIKITAEDMKEMFEFPLRRMYELPLEQLQQARRAGKVQIKSVFMVGGFSESPYMYEKIKTFAEANSLQAIRPVHAWSAVIRGACAKGLEGDGRAQIKNRKCRRFYGTSFSSSFVLGQHSEADSFICQYTNTKKARYQMKWLVKKGQDLSTKNDSHAKMEFLQDFWPGQERTMSVILLATDADKAPTHSKHKSVYTVATLDVDLTGVPRHSFRRRKSPTGGFYYSLRFQVEISVHSSLEYSLLVDGVRYGSVVAKYA